jgi:hypothetical protein
MHFASPTGANCTAAFPLLNGNAFRAFCKEPLSSSAFLQPEIKKYALAQFQLGGLWRINS